MQVLLAGASGVIGRVLLRLLTDQGHQVIALSRHPADESSPAVTWVAANALIKDDLLRALASFRADAVISQLTALRKPPARHRDMRRTNQLRTVGTANLIAAAQRLGARRFLTQSMMFGYGYDNQGGRLRTETDPFAPRRTGPFEEHLAAMRQNEERVLSDPEFDGVALRYGLFYGGAASQTLLTGVQKHALPVLAGDAAPLSFVHVEDAAAATMAALTADSVGGQAFNVADDEPVSWTTFVTHMAERAGAATPLRLPAWVLQLAAPYGRVILEGGVCIFSAKARQDLNWTPIYRNIRQGIDAAMPRQNLVSRQISKKAKGDHGHAA
jgi:nucleoside-diphosphate-sugar epimerase